MSDMPINLKTINKNKLLDYIKSFGYNNIKGESVERDLINSIVYFETQDDFLWFIDFDESDFEENWR